VRKLLQALVALSLSTSLLSAQTAERTLAGKVTVLRGSAARAVGGTWVTLHRVGKDGAAPLDSMRSTPGGEFRFRFKPTGDSTAVYFAATQYSGIAYFTPPARANTPALGGEITVFDTTSVLVPLTIVSRHVIIASPDSANTREVLELYVLSNAGDKTLITSPSRSSTFETKLPAQAVAPRVEPGDVAAEALNFGAGIVRVLAAIAPGQKRVSYSYRLPASADPIEFSPAGAAELLEVLVEDPAAAVTGAGITEDAPTSADGRTFRRFVGRNFAGGSGISVLAPSGAKRALSLYGVLVAGSALAMGIALVLALRRSKTSP
jgi:hypothetical protein